MPSAQTAFHVLLAISPLCLGSASAVQAQDSAHPAASHCDAARATLWAPGGGEALGGRGALWRAAEVAGTAAGPSGLLRRSSQRLRVPLCPDGVHAASPELRKGAPAGAFEARLQPVRLRTAYNSAYPDDRNNGAALQGRGGSAALSGGAFVRWGPISAAAHPTAVYERNASFETVPLRTGIDWQQPSGSYQRLDPGQSYVRLDVLGLAAGVSTENLWWGPALEHSLLFSNTAPGFPHLFIGTARPVDVGIGRIEVEMVVGETRESEGFNAIPGDDYNRLNAIGVAFHPRGLGGLSIGAAGVQTTALDARENVLRSLFGVFGQKNPAGNALGSVFARWLMPESAFGVHLELARDDAWNDLQDLLGEPEHSLAYMVGLEKGAPVGGHWLHAYGELVHLEGSSAFRSRYSYVTFYTHSRIRQGHTHQGQLLGAAVGPGSNALTLGADLYTDRGQFGLMIERVVYGNDAYLMRVTRAGGADGDRRDIEHSVRLGGTLFIGPIDVDGTLSYAHRPERGLVDLLTGGEVTPPSSNLGLILGMRWYPGTRRAHPPTFSF